MKGEMETTQMIWCKASVWDLQAWNDTLASIRMLPCVTDPPKSSWQRFKAWFRHHAYGL